MKNNGSENDYFPDISDIFDIDEKNLPDKPIERAKAEKGRKDRKEPKEKILTSPDGARFLPKDVQKQMKKDEKKRRRDIRVKKLKKRLIIIGAVLAAALIAAGIIAFRIADAKKPLVTVEKAAAESIERSQSGSALVFSDGLVTTAVLIDNDYDVHNITKNISAEVKTTSGTVIPGTVTDIREEKKGSPLFEKLATALLNESPEVPFCTVTLTIDDTAGVLSDGEKVTARVITKTVEKTITVPASSVFTADGQSFVWIYHPVTKKLTRQDVELGIASETKIEVIRGLSKGDPVLSGASCTSAELYDGIKVKIK